MDGKIGPDLLFVKYWFLLPHPEVRQNQLLTLPPYISQAVALALCVDALYSPILQLWAQ